MTLFKIFISALLIDNIVLMRFLALCPFIGMSTDEDKSIGMGLAVTFVTVLATCVTWPLYHFVLLPLGLEFLQILAFILIIAALVQLVEFYLKKAAPSLYASMGIYLALITTNCAILGVTFDNITKGFGFIEAVVYAIGVALGFMLSLLLLAGIRKRIKTSPLPSFMKGTPILFVAAGLLSMAFMGFAGLVK
ncbi:electron transport complex protein RnfA [Breznakiella homolactica]|uniref:Ion-translocating oxidoreductase complex subunit A n=1 Tax=Breznakiella homolactica TaxID=2798577 RepID=A0A7T7XNZ3_9SPIR|nr:RnfABCDGE type electron transport complex subunit A [Breznakiella homolactica]QQO09854.1 RnfABCDGE type electron transport complex subunit A [Breznakiella homolactica]